jgi:thiol-disulfide isomerase/thioredoxin
MLHETSNWGDIEDTVAAVGHTVVYFSASWCDPCKRTKPQYARASVIDLGANYFLVDIDELDDKSVLEKFGVMSIPALIFITKDSWTKIEARTAEAIVSEVANIYHDYTI